MGLELFTGGGGRGICEACGAGEVAGIDDFDEGEAGGEDFHGWIFRIRVAAKCSGKAGGIRGTGAGGAAGIC